MAAGVLEIPCSTIRHEFWPTMLMCYRAEDRARLKVGVVDGQAVCDVTLEHSSWAGRS
jgi:hypothetical protein